jgi:hypothetical protein
MILKYMAEDDEMEDLEYKIGNVEKTDMKAAETGLIYQVTLTITYTDPETGDTETDTESIMVAKNSQNGKWGIALEGFDIEMTADEHEPDDDPESATEIGPGKSAGHNLHTDEDEDWYVFTIDAMSNVRIWVDGDFGGDTEMFMYSEDDTEDYIHHNDDRDDDAFSEIDEELDAGTYYVKIIPYESSETVIDYTLEIEIS